MSINSCLSTLNELINDLNLHSLSMKKTDKKWHFCRGSKCISKIIHISHRALKTLFAKRFGETSANTSGNDKWFIIKKVHCAHLVSFDTIINNYTPPEWHGENMLHGHQCFIRDNQYLSIINRKFLWLELN